MMLRSRLVSLFKSNHRRLPKAERLEPRRLLSATDPTVAEQYMLELVNRARANPAAEAAADGIALNEGLSPGTLSPDPKQPLAFNPQLTLAARNHTGWMINSNSFSHDEAGVDPGAQITAAGYQFQGASGWGQNIAYRGVTPQVPPLIPTVAQEERDLFVDSGEAGRGHRVNLLDGAFKEVGVGIQEAPFQGYNSVVVTQDFAYTSGNSFLTGVAFSDNIVHDHFYTPGEGLGGITITAVRDSDHASFSTTTWSAGGYTLPLAAGTYTVTATGTGLGTVVDSGVVIGSQNVELDFTPMHAPPPGQTTPPAGVGWVFGTVFRDRNGNGVRDRGEPLLGQYRIFADLNNDGIWERNEPSALTNSRGVFRLQLPPGSYTIRQVLVGRYVLTTPVDGSFQVNVTAGQSITGLTFGNRLPPPPKRPAHSPHRFGKVT